MLFQLVPDFLSECGVVARTFWLADLGQFGNPDEKRFEVAIQRGIGVAAP
jgi:hypothetical protein